MLDANNKLTALNFDSAIWCTHNNFVTERSTFDLTEFCTFAVTESSALSHPELYPKLSAFEQSELNAFECPERCAIHEPKCSPKCRTDD